MVVNPDDPHPVTKEHVFWFGVIITEFARFELRMHLAAAGILNQDIGTAMILLGGMNFRQKVQTVWHLNRTIGADGKSSPEIAESLIEARKLSKLRNYIAHSTWTEGRKKGAIKPMFVGTHGDTLKVMGHDHNEPEYDVARLEAEARRLDATSQSLLDFLESSGLWARVQAKIETTASQTDSGLGGPNSK